MVLRIIQHLLLCATYGAVVLTYEIELEPSTAVVQENGSINLTCRYEKQLTAMVFEINPDTTDKSKSTIFFANCTGEGPIADNAKSYDFYCIHNNSLTVTLKSVQRSQHMEKIICNSFSTTNRSLSSNESTIIVTIPVDHIVFQNESNTPVGTMEGLKTVFVCITEHVYPEPEIIWFVNSTVLQNTTHNVFIEHEATENAYPGSYMSILTMFPKRSDNFSLIYCDANNVSRSSGNVRMLVYFPPDTPTLTKNELPITGHISVVVGNPLTIVCLGQSYPTPHYKWTIENRVVAERNILDISNVSNPNHTGTFTCKVNNMMPLYSGNQYGSNETSVTVEVLYSPLPPNFLFNNNQNQKLSDNNLQVVRGDNFSITCEADSNPESTYKWTGYENSPEMNIGNTTASIFITSLSVDVNLSCIATNTMQETNGGTSNGRSSSTLTVIVQYPPEHIRIQINGQTLIENDTSEVVEGTTLTISCNATSVPPPSEFQLVEEHTFYNVTTTKGGFQIYNVTRHHAGKYMLTVINRMLPSFKNQVNGTSNLRFNLDVLYGSRVKRLFVNEQAENVTVNEKDNVTISCEVDGKPLPNVTILYDGKVLKKQSGDEMLRHTMNNVTCAQMGEYECQSSNKHNNKGPSSATINIGVACSPRPNQNMSLQSKFASAMFVHKTISFEIYAFPEPGEGGFIWYKWENATSGINLYNDDSTSISTSGLQSNLTLRNITQHSFGKYQLNVTNNIGVYTHDFVLSPNDKPQPATHFHYIEALTTDTSICMSWRPGFNGGLPQTFILDYRKLESNSDWSSISVLDAKESEMNTTVLSLTRGTVYEFKLMSTNKKGNSSAVGPVTIKTKELGEVNSSTGRLFVTAMSVGVFSIIVIVALSVGVVVYKRRSNKKKTDTPYEATVENRNGSGHVLPNERATSSTLEEFDDMGIYENVLFTTSPTTTSIVSTKKLLENEQGTKRRTSQTKNKRKTNKGRKRASRVTYMEDCPTNRIETIRQPESESALQNDGNHKTRIPVSSLFSYVTNSSYDTEFSLLPKGLQYPATVARKPENIALNRYNSLFPYDHSRVVLLNDPTFYMNACYIDGYRKRKAYIASLGPTAETTNNYITFWKMVWYENSDIIVMLTNLIEISGMKCQQYWPEQDKMEHYGEVGVYCRHVEVFAEYTIRTFDVSKNKVVRQLHQLHFTAWPDKKVPDDMSSLLEFRQRLQRTFTTEHGPIIIHCSAGVGRTGTLIAINNLIDEGNREGNVDVLACVKRLREQRVNLVQTEQQYCFIYKTLVYALEYETDSITAEMFQKYLESKDDSYFENVFGRLQINIESDTDVESRLINQDRTLLNRSGADIPGFFAHFNSSQNGNKYRVRLYLDKQADDLDYINAVYLNSFKKKRYFIAAQTPTHVTIEDFIRMIFQENCICIISLGESETHENVYQNEDIGLYLPPDNQTLTVGNFTVSCKRLSTNPHYIVRRMKVKHDSKIYNEEKVSYHFQYTEWDVDKEFPNDPSEFAHFMTDVDQYIAKNTESFGHVLVHCLDASERCGLFCSIATMIEKVECENHVNIGNTIRQIRSMRRTVIQNMKQFRFCHQAVNAYINMVR